jgi:hypothetical protein
MSKDKTDSSRVERVHDGAIADLQQQASPTRSCSHGLRNQRDTTKARYITPENSSIMDEGARHRQERYDVAQPDADSVVKLRKSSSIHVRGLPEPARAPKLPGSRH